MQPNSNSHQDKKSFRANKEDVHDEIHGGGHGTEMGWLVSYADMMTLLFGLFVILFSLSSDKSKDVDEVMKEASKKYFRSGEAEVLTPAVPKDKPVPAPVSEVKIKTVEVPSAEQQKKIEEQTKQIEELQNQIKKVQQEKKRTISAVAAAQPPPDTTEKDQELEQVKKENAALKDELSKEKNKNPMQNYMMVLISWETEKHDLDLKITAPDGKKFDFKKRRIKDEPGAFELDSRYGPGVEMWRAENFKPGRYNCKVTLYNKNGNEAKPQFHLNVVTNLQNIKTPVIEIDTKQPQKEIVFEVDKEGVVKLIDLH